MNSKEVIGIDLGGTSIKVGRISEGKIDVTATHSTPKTTNEEEVTQCIIDTIKQVMQPTTQAIGIGIPSVVDIQKGIVYDVMNIPSWKEVPIKDILENEFNVPVYVNNDANCFAIGEKIFGKGKAYEHFVGLTLGTGLGAGIIQKGRLLEDANCGSGEFCVVPYRESDYEHYCSGMFFQMLKEDGQDVYDRAKQRDERALNIFEELGFHMANLVKLVVSTIDPQMIVLGGSVSQSFSLFKEAMYQELKNYEYTNSIKKLKIEVSDTENSAILGAAALCY